MFFFNSVADIDCALGYFKHQFNLSADEVRLVAAKNPKLITRNRDHLDVMFSISYVLIYYFYVALNYIALTSLIT